MHDYTLIFSNAFNRAIEKVGVNTLKKSSLFGRNAERLNNASKRDEASKKFSKHKKAA